MELIGPILVLAVLIFVGYWVDRGRKAATRKLNQSVFEHRDHLAGTAVTDEIVTLTTSAPIDDVMVQIRVDMNAESTPPILPLLPIRYLLAETADRVDFAYGTLTQERFVVRVSAVPRKGGTRVTFRVLRWTLADGIVRDISELQRMSEVVRTAVESLDPLAARQITSAKAGSK